MSGSSCLPHCLVAGSSDGTHHVGAGSADSLVEMGAQMWELPGDVAGFRDAVTNQCTCITATAPRCIALCKALPYGTKNVFITSDRFADHEWLRISERLPDAFPPRNFAHAVVAAAVLKDDQVACTEGSMRTAQV